MRVATRCLAPLLLAGVGWHVPVFAQALNGAHATIVSADHAVDSKGETVYEPQVEDSSGDRVVPGVLAPPAVLKQPQPKFSSALRRERFNGEVTVAFVVTAKGETIDFETNPAENQEAIARALKAVRKYRFAPATLDGNPVATRIEVLVAFSLM